jgi:hypothetical protein
VCRYAIERVKQVAPIWKHEFFEDGDAWVEGATADPDDAIARQEALARHARETCGCSRGCASLLDAASTIAKCRPARRSTTCGRP